MAAEKTFALDESSLAKLFGFTHSAIIMSDNPESNEAVSQRCIELRRAVEFPQSSAFAKFLGVSPQRWNNVEIGMPLSRDLAMTLVRKIPGLSLDWLYRGRTEGMSLDLARSLGGVSSVVIKRSAKARR